jgi:hypothetical protein
MVHYIRDSHNNTIVDIDASVGDLHAVVVIESYSKYLLNLSHSFKTEFVNDMGALQEIRGEYFERNRNRESPDQLAARRCKEIATKWKLVYVTD